MRHLRLRPTARIAHSSRARVVLAVAAVSLGVGAAIAVASVPGGDGVIHACYLTAPGGAPLAGAPNVRIIDPSAGQACNPPAGAGSPEATLAWNTAGPAGPQGPAGANGTATIEQPAAAPAGGPVGTLTLTEGPKTTVRADLFDVSTIATGPGSQAGGSARTKVPATEIKVTKHLDSSSPKLAAAIGRGTGFDIATIVIYKPGTTAPGTTLKLKSAQIVSDEATVSSRDTTPTETLTLVAKTWQTTTSGGGSGLPAVQKIVGIQNPKA